MTPLPCCVLEGSTLSLLANRYKSFRLDAEGYMKGQVITSDDMAVMTGLMMLSYLSKVQCPIERRVEQ